MKTTSLLATILALTLSISAGAQPTISLDQSTNIQNIGLNADFVEEPQGKLQLNQLLSSDLEWQSSQSAIINFGFTKSTYWYRLKLHNISENAQEYLFTIEYALLDKVDIYDDFSHTEFGRLMPFSNRAFKHRYFVHPIKLLADQKATIYVRVATQSAMQVPMSIRTKKSFIENEQGTLFVQGLYFGSIIVMFIYNLFLYFSTRDKIYLYYSTSVFFIGWMQATLRGFTSQYIFSDSPLFQVLHLPIVINLSAAFLGVFTITFLELKTRSKTLYYITWFFILVLVFNALTSPMIDYRIAIVLPAFITIIHAMISNYSGFYIWYRGFKPAKYYAIAYSMFMIAVVVHSTNKLGIIPRNFLTEYALEIGSILEIILLSFALAYRINILKQEKVQAQRDLSVNLEKKVLERTEELDDAMHLLSSLNDKLARQNIEDGLLGIYNRRYFDKSIAQQWDQSVRSNVPIALIMADIDYFKNFNDEHGHAVGDDCLRLVADCIKSSVTRMNDKVCRYGGEEFAILLQVTDLAGGKQIAENIRVAVEEKVLLTHAGSNLSVTISLGVASVIPKKGERFESLVRHADTALYQAKELGRNRVELYNEEPQKSKGNKH